MADTPKPKVKELLGICLYGVLNKPDQLIQFRYLSHLYPTYQRWGDQIKESTRFPIGLYVYVLCSLAVGTQMVSLLFCYFDSWVYNLATLFLGDITTGTWLSKLGESQMRE
jgi:hypothetical protein